MWWPGILFLLGLLTVFTAILITDKAIVLISPSVTPIVSLSPLPLHEGWFSTKPLTGIGISTDPLRFIDEFRQWDYQGNMLTQSQGPWFTVSVSGNSYRPTVDNYTLRLSFPQVITSVIIHLMIVSSNGTQTIPVGSEYWSFVVYKEDGVTVIPGVATQAILSTSSATDTGGTWATYRFVEPLSPNTTYMLKGTPTTIDFPVRTEIYHTYQEKMYPSLVTKDPLFGTGVSEIDPIGAPTFNRYLLLLQTWMNPGNGLDWVCGNNPRSYPNKEIYTFSAPVDLKEVYILGGADGVGNGGYIHILCVNKYNTEVFKGEAIIANYDSTVSNALAPDPPMSFIFTDPLPAGTEFKIRLYGQGVVVLPSIRCIVVGRY